VSTKPEAIELLSLESFLLISWAQGAARVLGAACR